MNHKDREQLERFDKKIDKISVILEERFKNVGKKIEKSSKGQMKIAFLAIVLAFATVSVTINISPYVTGGYGFLAIFTSLFSFLLMMLIIIFAVSDYFHSEKQKNEKKDKKKPKFKMGKKTLLIIQITLTLVTAVLMVVTVFKAYETAELNERIVDWYENPKPLISHSSKPRISNNPDYPNTISTVESYDPELGIKNFPHETNSFNITIINSGRIPLANGEVELDIQVDNFNEENYQVFPVKILNFSTSLGSFWFKENNNRSLQTMIFHGNEFNRYINKFGVYDFPPTINYSSGDLKYYYPIPDLNLINLGIEKETWIYLKIFATEKNVTGYVNLTIKGSNISPYEIKIPIASI